MNDELRRACLDFTQKAEIACHLMWGRIIASMEPQRKESRHFYKEVHTPTWLTELNTQIEITKSYYQCCDRYSHPKCTVREPSSTKSSYNSWMIGGCYSHARNNLVVCLVAGRPWTLEPDISPCWGFGGLALMTSSLSYADNSFKRVAVSARVLYPYWRNRISARRFHCLLKLPGVGYPSLAPG